MKSGKVFCSCFAKNSDDINVCDKFVAGFNGVIINNSLFFFKAVERNSCFLKVRVNLSANVKFTSPYKYVFGTQVQILIHRKGQVSIYCKELDNSALVAIKYHIPSSFDFNILVVDRDLATWPIRRIAPVPRVVLIRLWRINWFVARPIAS